MAEPIMHARRTLDTVIEHVDVDDVFVDEVDLDPKRNLIDDVDPHRPSSHAQLDGSHPPDVRFGDPRPFAMGVEPTEAGEPSLVVVEASVWRERIVPLLEAAS